MKTIKLEIYLWSVVVEMNFTVSFNVNNRIIS